MIVFKLNLHRCGE